MLVISVFVPDNVTLKRVIIVKVIQSIVIFAYQWSPTSPCSSKESVMSLVLSVYWRHSKS